MKSFQMWVRLSWLVHFTKVNRSACKSQFYSVRIFLGMLRKHSNGNTAVVFLHLYCAQTRLHCPEKMPITYRLSPWFHVAFSCQDWLMSRRGLVLYFPFLKYRRQRSLRFVDRPCMNPNSLSSEQLFWGCRLKQKKPAGLSPYLACSWGETPDEAHLALLLTPLQGQSLGQMLPYHLPKRLVWRMIVYNKETSSINMVECYTGYIPQRRWQILEKKFLLN